MATRWLLVFAVVVLVLLAVGCISGSTKKGFSFTVTHVKGTAYGIKNATAVDFRVVMNVEYNNRSMRIIRDLPTIIFITGDNVVGADAFSLSKGIYEVPYYKFKDNGLVSVDIRLQNGSIGTYNFKVSGIPRKVVNITLNMRVIKSDEYYTVKIFKHNTPVMELWNRTFKTKIVPNTMQVTWNFKSPTAKYLGNWTYRVPTTCSSISVGMRVELEYPLANIYIVLNESGIIGSIYFPCEELDK